MSGVRHMGWPWVVPALLAVAQLACLGSAPSRAVAAPPAPEAFAYGIRMTPDAPRAVHTALLPEVVYRGTSRPDLGDLRVFNAEGERLPHAVRVLPAPVEQPPVVAPVPFFALPEAPEGAASQAPPGATALRVERDASGAVVDLRIEPGAEAQAANQAAEQAARVPSAYLIDLRSLAAPVTELSLRLADGHGDYSLPVSVDTSDDLDDYTRGVAQHTLVHLSYGSQRVQHDALPLPRVAAAFLRVRFAQPPPTPLAEVSVRVASGRPAAPTRTLALSGRPLPDEPGAYLFDAGGPVPVDGLRLRLPEDNTVVVGTLATREAGASADAPAAPGERVLHRDTFYRVVHEGQRLETGPLALPRLRSRYWVLRLDPAGPGLGDGVPELALSRVPDQLLFVARGGAPYLLAYGQRDLDSGGLDAETLLSVLPEADRQALPDATVELGEVQTLAGPKALLPPPNYGTYALWAVLVLGVLGLLAMAVKLARDPS